MAERRIQLEDLGEFSKFIQEVKTREWQTLANPLDEINVDIIREFYANAKPEREDAMLTITSWVRGREISYD